MSVTNEDLGYPHVWVCVCPRDEDGMIHLATRGITRAACGPVTFPVFNPGACLPMKYGLDDITCEDCRDLYAADPERFTDPGPIVRFPG